MELEVESLVMDDVALTVVRAAVTATPRQRTETSKTMMEVETETLATNGVMTTIGTPSHKIVRLTTMTVVGVEAATSTSMTTTEFGAETLATKDVVMTPVGAAVTATFRQRTKMSKAMMEAEAETSATDGVTSMIGTPSQKIMTLTTMTVVGVEAAMSTTTTEFGFETLVTDDVGMMTGTPCKIETLVTGDAATRIGTPCQIKKLPKMTAAGVEAAATLCQWTKMLMTTTEAGAETLVTNCVGTMIGTHQFEKLTTTMAVGVEMLTMLRQRTKISTTAMEVGVETSVTSGNAMIIGSESQTKKSTPTTMVGVEAATMSRQQTKTLSTTTEVGAATPVTGDVASTMTDDSF
jgi:hypothetical protein